MLLNLNHFMPGDNKMQDIKATGLFKCFQNFSQAKSLSERRYIVLNVYNYVIQCMGAV